MRVGRQLAAQGPASALALSTRPTSVQHLHLHTHAHAHAHAHSHHPQRSRALSHPTCMLCTRLSVASSWRWKVSRISMFSAATQSANPSSSSPLALRLRRGVAGQGIKPAARHMPLTAQRRPLQSLAALHISTQQWSATSQPGPPEPHSIYCLNLPPPPSPRLGHPRPRSLVEERLRHEHHLLRPAGHQPAAHRLRAVPADPPIKASVGSSEARWQRREQDGWCTGGASRWGRPSRAPAPPSSSRCRGAPAAAPA